MSSEDSGMSIEPASFKPQTTMKGLGIRGLSENETAAIVPTDSDASDVIQGEFPTSHDDGTPYLPLHGSPSSSSVRSSGPTTQESLWPQTPVFFNSFSQYGSGMNTFNSEAQSLTPTKRSEGTKGNRPMLMRTPPSDHPFTGIQVLSRDDGDEDMDMDDDLEDAIERDERRSSVAELPLSPSHLAFGRAPNSPPSPDTPISPRSPNTLLPDRLHSRQSSNHRVHARNLSTFFPRPGQPVPPQSPGTTRNRFAEAPVTDIPSKPARRSGSESLRGWTFGQPRAQQDGLVPPKSPLVDALASSLAPPPSPGKVGRRGHHHKHSLSHNFFSFLDPTETNPALSSLTTDASPLESSIPPPSATPKPVPTAFIQGSTSENPASASSPLLPYPSQQVRSGSFVGFLFSLAPLAQLALGLGLLEFFVGACLWVDGQAVGSVSITGLGYLVVYDAIGVGIRVLGSIMRTGEGSQSSLRRPFGNHRIESLLYFVQAIFLLFACVYIAKESVEHLLLEGHHHHGAGAHGDHYDLEFPVNLLIPGIVASFFAGVKLQNHAVLVEVVGSEVLGQTDNSDTKMKRPPTTGLPTIFSNPFTLAVAGTCSIALIGSLVLPVHHLDALDKALSMLETFLCYWIAYPSAVAFGTVLLQTAPASKTVQMNAFDLAIKEITQHRSVIKVAPPHIWQLTPFQPDTLVDDRPYASPAHSRRTSLAEGFLHSRQTTPKTAQLAELLKQVYPQRRKSSAGGSRFGVKGKSGGCILVATVVIHVVEDSDTATVLEITRLAYERCASAMGLSRDKKRGGEWEMGGELTIAVQRGEGKVREERGGEGDGHGTCDGHHAGHDHGHEKENGHHHHQGNHQQDAHEHHEHHHQPHDKHEHHDHDHKNE